MLLGMRCPSCGTENAPDSRFCGGCGARLEPSRVAPTFRIPDDAAYPAAQPAVPTPPPGSLHAIGHLPTPTPGSLQMPPQPRLGSIPPTNPAPALNRAASVPPIERHSSVPPTERLPSKPPGSIPPTDVQRPTPLPAAEPSMSMPAVPRRSGALIAVVVIADLGLAAAGAALLMKGLQKPRPAAKPALKTEALPPPAAAAAADLTAPAPAPAPVLAPPEPPKPKEAAKKAPVKPAPKKKTTAPVDPYGDAPDLAPEIERMAQQSVGSFRNCLSQAIQTQPIHGDVRIAFVVEPDGRVDHVRVASDTTESPQLATCLAATIATWTFAPHPGPAASFERPFNYP
jgi:TonB family protein